LDKSKHIIYKPTEEITPDGRHIVRGFKIPAEPKSSERAQDHESLSQPSYNTTDTAFREDHLAMKFTSDELDVTNLPQPHSYGNLCQDKGKGKDSQKQSQAK